MKSVVSNELSVSLISKRAKNANGGPGNAGTIHPMYANIKRIMPKIITPIKRNSI